VLCPPTTMVPCTSMAMLGKLAVIVLIQHKHLQKLDTSFSRAKGLVARYALIMSCIIYKVNRCQNRHLTESTTRDHSSHTVLAFTHTAPAPVKRQSLPFLADACTCSVSPEYTHTFIGSQLRSILCSIPLHLHTFSSHPLVYQ
jgi:hypothetical protein